MAGRPSNVRRTTRNLPGRSTASASRGILYREARRRLNHRNDCVSLGRRRTLHHTWTHLGRWVASMMLVALASLVLQGSAMACGAPPNAASATSAAADLDTRFDGAGPQVVVHEQHHQDGSAPSHHGANAPCCTMFCAAALTPAPPLLSVDRTVANSIPSASEVEEHGIFREGPRRPPRTPDIA